MSTPNKISTLVRQQFPSFYEEEGEQFLDFVQSYYEYLEENGNLTDAIQNLKSYRDINTTLDEYLEYFRRDLLPSIPNEIAADKRLFAKYIHQFNQSRGTLASYKLLFRALYNENVEVYYPAEQILKVSDGDWRMDRYLVTAYDPRAYSFIGKTIKGVESQAEALVEDVVKIVVRGRDVMKIVLSNIKGFFNHLEPVKLKSDTGGGFSIIVEAGINRLAVKSIGADYSLGDVVDLVSSDNGYFGKAVVTAVRNSGGALSYNLISGGSGYTATYDYGGTKVTFIGGDGYDKGGFEIFLDDIEDTFAISININLIQSNNIFGESAPTITFPDRSGTPSGLMSTFANTPLSSPRFGFPEQGEEVTKADFHEHANAAINIANTSTIPDDAKLYGGTSGANAQVRIIVDGTSGDSWFKVDGHKNWQVGEDVHLNTASGDVVGTVTDWQGNTAGHQILQFGYWANTTSAINDGTEVHGLTSNAYGVIKSFGAQVLSGWSEGTDVRDLLEVVVTSNATSSIDNRWSVGPMQKFIQGEDLEVVGGDFIGTVANDTSNTVIENVYTSLRDSLIFKATYFGTIQKLSNQVSGAGYTIAPTIKVRENDVASLGIGEAWLRLITDDKNWNSANSLFEKCDTNDKIIGLTSRASGDVKGGLGTQAVFYNEYELNKWEMWVRVWQDPQQRTPGQINWRLGENVRIDIFNQEHIPYEPDTRSVADTAYATIAEIIDGGVLGDNANITAGVGANGVVSALRPFDSGFSYRNNEVVILKDDKYHGSLATAQISLKGVGNSEGYYASSRGHISSIRSILQDNNYYHEYSYELQTALPFSKYKDVVLKLVHPAGQAVFNKYKLQSNVYLDVVASSEIKKRAQANAWVSIANGSTTITNTLNPNLGASYIPNFADEFANGDIMVIETSPGEYISMPLNIVINDTTANTRFAWTGSSISGANAYYLTGTIV